MGIVALILALPIIVGLVYFFVEVRKRLGGIQRTAAAASQIAFFATLIAAGIMVIAPVTQIGLLSLLAGVLYVAFLILGGRHLWRWIRAIINSEKMPTK